jgi:hypothetical protein
MHTLVHQFEPHVGGVLRISLIYDNPTGTGKTTPNTDTFCGTFVELLENERITEIVTFETSDPALADPMTITTVLSDADDGTDLVVTHDPIPGGVAPEDNELGTRTSLDKLARLVEPGSKSD